MRIVYSDDHRLHHSAGELQQARMAPAVETPERVLTILRAVEAAGLGPVTAPDPLPPGALARVHTPAYLRFLETGYDAWAAAFGGGDAMAINWAVRGLGQREPDQIEGRLGYFSGDAGTPLTPGTWRAASAAAACAVTATRLVLDGAPLAYALSRPPGHHASADVMNGYCYLNHAAIAAETARAGGAARVAVLDVDYHHGNGTQAIFYDRDDVLFVSLHCDPAVEYPFFLGHADETGSGAGHGATLNLPLPKGTEWPAYAEALAAAMARVDAFAPDLLVVSFGADTYALDPISHFRLGTDDFARMGGAIRRPGRPTVVIQEGGYAVEALGRNVVRFLEGLAG